MSDDLKARTERLLALRDKATPGPWFLRTNRHRTTNGLYWGWLDFQRGSASGPDGINGTWTEGERSEHNCKFVAAAHDMVDLIRDQQSEIERLRGGAVLIGYLFDDYSPETGRDDQFSGAMPTGEHACNIRPLYTAPPAPTVPSVGAHPFPVELSEPQEARFAAWAGPPQAGSFEESVARLAMLVNGRREGLIDYKAAQIFARELLQRVSAQAPAPAVPDGHAQGIAAAARWVNKRAEDYDREHGVTDPTTGMREYPGNGDEYMDELLTIEEGIKALAAVAAAPEVSRG